MKFFKIIFVSIVFIVLSQIKGVTQNIPYQKIILLNSLTNKYNVNSYTLKTNELYNVDKQIEIYNVELLKGYTIVLFSVLPSFNSTDNWEKVDLQSIKNKMATLADVRAYARKNHSNEFDSEQNTNTFEFRLLKKTNTGYYISKICLTEKFDVRSYPPPLVTPYKTINIQSSIVTIKEMLTKFPAYMSSMDARNNDMILPDNIFLRREYLSKIFKINEDTAYQFWTFTDWNRADGWNIQRGIDRFIYVPGKGIVGGSYDFWFAFKPLREVYITKGIPVSGDKLWDNIINERVMLAEEL